jgi:hypothetical protein
MYMTGQVTISKQKYEELRRQAAAWRRAIGDSDDTVIFNALRDNAGKGIPVEKFIRILRKLEREEHKNSA